MTLVPSSSLFFYSTIDVDKPEVMDSVKDLEKSEKIAEQERETTELVQNGLDSTCASVSSSPTEKTRLTEPRLVLPAIHYYYH